MPAVCPWSSVTYDGKEIPVRKNGVAVKPPWGGRNVLVGWSKNITSIAEFVAKIDKTIERESEAWYIIFRSQRCACWPRTWQCSRARLGVLLRRHPGSSLTSAARA